MFSMCLLILIYCICWVVVIVILGTGLYQAVMVMLFAVALASWLLHLWVVMISVCCIHILLWRVWVWGGVPVVGCRQVLLFTSGKCLTCLWLYGIQLVQSVKWTVIWVERGFLHWMTMGDFLLQFSSGASYTLQIYFGSRFYWCQWVCEVWAGRSVPAACGGDLRFYTVMWMGLYVLDFAICDGILLCFALSNGCLGSVILLFKPAWFMLLVLWTLYSVSALAFRAVSTKSCGGFVCVLGQNLQFWNPEKRGKQGEHFPRPVITICLNIWVFFFFFFFFWFTLGWNLLFLEFWRVGEQGKCFPCFPGLVIMVCLNYCARYELESIAVRAVSCGCWGLRTCFWRG